MHTLFHNVAGAASSVVETRPAFGAFGVGAEATCDGAELGDVLRRLKELAGALPTADAGHLVSPGAGGTNNNYVGGFHEQYKAYLLHYAALLRGLGAAQPASYGATPGKGVPEILARPAGANAPGELLAVALQHQLQLLLRPRPYTPQPPAGPLQPLLALLRQLQPQPQPQTPDATESCDAWRRWYQLFEACGPRPDPTAAATAVEMPRTTFPPQCEVDMPCGPSEPLGSRARLASPLQVPSPGPQQRFQCDCCHKSYSTFSGLTKHKQFHCVSQVKKQFNCKYCDKSYVSLGALKMHIRTHTLPCKCQICGKAFSRPWLLNGHIRTHTGEKPFKCDFCGRAFADRSNLRAHLQTHSDVKKYSCKLCNKTFSRMSLLVKHTETVCGAQQDTKTCSAESISPSSVCSDQQDTASFSAV